MIRKPTANEIDTLIKCMRKLADRLDRGRIFGDAIQAADEALAIANRLRWRIRLDESTPERGKVVWTPRLGASNREEQATENQLHRAVVVLGEVVAGKVLADTTKELRAVAGDLSSIEHRGAFRQAAKRESSRGGVKPAEVNRWCKHKREEMGKNYTELVAKVAKGDKRAKKQASEIFRQNRVMEALGCSAGTVQKSSEWKEISTALKLGRSKGHSPRQQNNLAVVLDQTGRADAEFDPIDEADDRIKVLKEINTAKISQKDKQALATAVTSGDNTPAQAREIIATMIEAADSRD